MKKGQIPTFVDFLAALAFILFVIILMTLMRFSHEGFNRDITNVFEGSAGVITLHTLLKEEIDFKGANMSFNELIARYATYTDKNSDEFLAITGNLTNITEELGLYNVNFVAKWKQSTVFNITSNDEFDCSIRSGKLLIAPLDAIGSTTARRPIQLELRYCE